MSYVVCVCVCAKNPHHISKQRATIRMRRRRAPGTCARVKTTIINNVVVVVIARNASRKYRAIARGARAVLHRKRKTCSVAAKTRTRPYACEELQVRRSVAVETAKNRASACVCENSAFQVCIYG